ncbi:MAG: hypothetical protein JWP87_3738 [Labilithrix sp.]|nr:hypothetical protein [Labilithrix sp.]
MRLSSIVSLVVVTASLALGGCAADAEPATGGTDQPNVALSDPNAPLPGRDRTGDVGYVQKISDGYANPLETAEPHMQGQPGLVEPVQHTIPPFAQTR